MFQKSKMFNCRDPYQFPEEQFDDEDHQDSECDEDIEDSQDMIVLSEGQGFGALLPEVPGFLGETDNVEIFSSYVEKVAEQGGGVLFKSFKTFLVTSDNDGFEQAGQRVYLY